MVQGSWVRHLLPISFFLLFFFSFYSSSPMSAPFARVGVGGFALSTSIPFFFFLFSLLFLGADVRPHSGGSRFSYNLFIYSIINKLLLQAALKGTIGSGEEGRRGNHRKVGVNR